MSKKTWEQIRELKKANKKMKLKIDRLEYELKWFKSRGEIMKKSFTEQLEAKNKKIKDLLHSKEPILNSYEKDLFEIIKHLKNTKLL